MRKPKLPSYRLHKSSGQAIVTIGGRDIYLGTYNSPESKQAYERLIAEFLVNGGIHRPANTPQTTVDAVIDSYVLWCEEYYKKNGEPTNQLERVERSLRFVHDLYGDTPANDFGPLKLKACRHKMIEANWVRGHINSCVGCIKRMFKWAVSEEILPAAVYQSLSTVEGLERGRCTAKESQKVKPVPEPNIAPVLGHLTSIPRAMAELQLLTGMRPGEVCQLRPCDIDRAGAIWTYRPDSHKTEHHGYERTIYFGPKAQSILNPYLGRRADAFCFSAREVSEEWLRNNGRAIVFGRERTPGERYQTTSYCRAIAKACKRAKVKQWHPHQLRHNAASRVRAEFGPDAARAILGHMSLRSTEIYAELDLQKAAEVAAKIG